MEWKNQLTKTPYLVLFIVLISVGVATASALATYTFSGNVVITDNLDVEGNLNVDGIVTGIETLEGLNCTNDQVARFDGSNWACGKQISKINPTITLDNIDDLGKFTSIAIGADGNPVISYFDDTNNNLKVVHCGNKTCSSGNTISTLDSAGSKGEYTSIAIGADGNPVISYYDSTDFNLKVVHCGNNTCSSGNTKTTLASEGIVGKHTSIAIGIDNNPVISYENSTSNDLHVVHCGNITCSSGNTDTIIDSSGIFGPYTSIAINSDNNPVISYSDAGLGRLKVAHCNNTSCSVVGLITTVDNTNDVGSHTSIVIGADGNPVISYYDFGNDNLKVLHCGNIPCSSGNTITTIDSTDNVGSHTSIAIGTDGNPVISYYDDTNNNLKVAHCGNTSCTFVNTITTIDSSSDVGQYSSIAIGADGNPVISYYDLTNGNLKVAVDGIVSTFD